MNEHKKTILNIHGLDGGSNNKNYRELVRLFGEERILSPQIDYRATPMEEILCSLEKCQEGTEFIVGKSLGGFLAAYLSAKWEIPCILVNPCIRPDLYLEKLMGDYLKENKKIIDQMMDAIKNADYIKENVRMILGKDDELLNPQDAIDFLPEVDTIMIPGGHNLFDGEFCKAFQDMLVKEGVLDKGDTGE